jgi:hypothetical protein
MHPKSIEDFYERNEISCLGSVSRIHRKPIQFPHSLGNKKSRHVVINYLITSMSKNVARPPEQDPFAQQKGSNLGRL